MKGDPVQCDEEVEEHWGAMPLPDLEEKEEADGDDQDSGDRLEDGGGWHSTADWLHNTGPGSSRLAGLRAACEGLVDTWGLVDRVKQGFGKGDAGLLSEEETLEARRQGAAFAQRHGERASGEVSPGQPFALEIWAALLNIIGDGDAELPKILHEGVPTGVFESIPGCSMYPPEDRDRKLTDTSGDELEACWSNWKSAEEAEASVVSLLQNEVEQGWVERLEGSWEAVSKPWEGRAAWGKLALVCVDGKEDRLVGDSSAPGISPKARFPNRMKHPKTSDLEEGMLRCREAGGDWVAITVDVRAAHKRMKVAGQDGGLAFFWFAGVWWRYLVCHFGASWSAWWWGRVSGALIRLLHAFLGAGHMAFNYVDDTVVFVRKEVSGRTAAVIGLFMVMLGVPVSWHKLLIGSAVQYIGIVVNLREWSLGLAAEKVERLRVFLGLFKKGERLDKRGLAKGLGQLQWSTAVVPHLRPWLAEFYRMLNLPGIHWVWLSERASWGVFHALGAEGVLTREAGGFAKGMSLSFVGKRVARTKKDWERVWRPGGGLGGVCRLGRKAGPGHAPSTDGY